MSTALQSSMTDRVDTGSAVAWKGKLQHSKPRLLLLLNDDAYFRVHRLQHARAARNAGMEVLVCTRADDDGKWIKDEGFTYLPIPFVKEGRQPLQELLGVFKLAKLYRQEKPDIVHHLCMKPILYGSSAARLAGIPAVVNTFTGLGFVFMKNGWRSRVLRAALVPSLRWAFGHPNCRAVFENSADRERLIYAKIVRRERTLIISGTGVDIGKFMPMAEEEETPIVVLACRMLWDKGVADFVEAARLLKKQNVAVRCVLVGTPDPGSPTSISEERLLSWQQERVVEWWGYREDMPRILRSAHVVVLPSFYEGLPTILLEACASARPVVTTAIPGCQAVVRDGENGFLVPVKDPGALARAIKVLLENPALRTRMGTRGREIVVREFSLGRVTKQVITVYRELLDNVCSV